MTDSIRIEIPIPGVTRDWAPMLNAALREIVRRVDGVEGPTDAAMATILRNPEATSTEILTGWLDELRERIPERADTIADTLAALSGAPTYPVGPFERLRAGVIDAELDTRVVFAGSSTSQGMSTFDWQGNAGLGVYQRLAALAGCSKILDGAAVTSAVPSQAGMRWWQFGGGTADSYLPAARRTSIARIAPQYVIHQIGSNDWANNVPLAVYRDTMRAVLTEIENGTPGVVNVLVHQQPRIDGTRAIAFGDYGRVLEDLAREHPARVFINMEEAFAPLGILAGNRAGIVTSDRIHMGNVGHKYAADFLARRMGIPTPTDFATGVDYREMTWAPLGDKNPGTEFAGVDIEAANYPRIAQIQGQIFARGPAAGEIITLFRSPGRDYGLQVQRMGVLNSDRGMTFDNTILIPAFVGGRVSAQVQAGTLYVSGNPGYTRGVVTLTPA